MDIVGVGAVLAKIQAFDNRNVSDETIMAWHEVLAPHTVGDALEAVTDYFKANTGWIMPAHVVERVRATEKRRIDEFRNGFHLNPADEQAAFESGEWSSACRALTRAVATGVLAPAAYEAYQAGEQPLSAFLGRKELGK